MTSMTPKELSELGLEPKLIDLHRRRIQAYFANPETNKLEVKDTCRIDNGGITPYSSLAALSEKDDSRANLQGFVAFIPAAGAASRYFQPLLPLIEALETKDQAGVEAALRSLASSGCEHWALPRSIQSCLKAEQPALQAMQRRDELLTELSRPKALQPAVLSGESFLELKRLEHRKIKGLVGQVFVVPIDQGDKFASQFKAHRSADDVSSFFLEQGPKLSTIRFLPDGNPYRDEDGKLSPVPAGHGTLIQILPQAKELASDAHSVFIRNIDNVMGDSDESIEASHCFLFAHQWLLQRVTMLRQLADKNRWSEGDDTCQEILNYYGTPLLQTDELKKLLAEIPEDEHSYWQVLIQVFHCSIEFAKAQIMKHGSSAQALISLLKRPVNSLGQVPNSGKDVGGAPVFTKAHEIPLSICLELPHATESDKQNYLSNPQKATHFNPVFVASEIVPAETYDLESSPFWILARKKYGRSDVVYHETVLYELLGNSVLANVVFPEIPRILFHPHKSLADSAGRNLSDWFETPPS